MCFSLRCVDDSTWHLAIENVLGSLLFYCNWKTMLKNKPITIKLVSFKPSSDQTCFLLTLTFSLYKFYTSTVGILTRPLSDYIRLLYIIKILEYHNLLFYFSGRYNKNLDFWIWHRLFIYHCILLFDCLCSLWLSCVTSMCFQAHVVAAFEQSLSNMTNRLQHLTSTAEQKASTILYTCFIAWNPVDTWSCFNVGPSSTTLAQH